MKILVAGLGGWAKADTAVEAFKNARCNGASVLRAQPRTPLYKMWLVGDGTYVSGMGHFTTLEGEPEPVLISHLTKQGALVKGDD